MGGSYCCGTRSEIPDFSVSAERLTDEVKFEKDYRSPQKSIGMEISNNAGSKVSILKNKNKANAPFQRSHYTEEDNGFDISKNLITRVSWRHKGFIRENREFYSKTVDRNVIWVIRILSKIEIDEKVWDVQIEAK